MFRVIVVTWPSEVSDEGERIADFLLNGGVDFVHVRKPGWGRERTEGLILSVPEELRGRLVLHDHFDLAVRYGLGGVHLNGRNASVPVGWGGRVSRSCHSLEEVRGCKGVYDYVSLSPVFDSISKVGYGAAFSYGEICEARDGGSIDEGVYALGGVRFDNLDVVREMGFGGALILGDAWRIGV